MDLAYEMIAGAVIGGVIAFFVRNWFETQKNLNDDDKANSSRIQDLEKEVAILKSKIVTYSDVESLIDKRITPISEKLNHVDLTQIKMSNTLTELLTEMRLMTRSSASKNF